MSTSVFTKIVQGEIPSYKIFEDEKCIAFLDAFPLMKGHVLVIPKIEEDYLFDLENSLYNHLFSQVKNISIAIKKATKCSRVGIIVAGYEVPHAHIHLIPTWTMDDMSFTKKKPKISKEEFEEIYLLIKSFL
jgi:histidine triad (HIT) family protein